MNALSFNSSNIESDDLNKARIDTNKAQNEKPEVDEKFFITGQQNQSLGNNVSDTMNLNLGDKSERV
jgi:hypothetical protein